MAGSVFITINFKGGYFIQQWEVKGEGLTISGVKTPNAGSLSVKVSISYDNTSYREVSLPHRIETDKTVFVKATLTSVVSAPVVVDLEAVDLTLTLDKVTKTLSTPVDESQCLVNAFGVVQNYGCSGNGLTLPSNYNVLGDVFQNASFNPYTSLAAAAQLQNQYNWMYNRLFGWDVKYFVADPDQKSADIILKEWGLSTMYKEACLKIVVPNNRFADSKFSYLLSDTSYDSDFEIYALNSHYLDIVGGTQGPDKGDVLYFPMMNRLFEVSSSYLYRDLLYAPSYWKISLKKYQDRKAIRKSESVADFIDNLTLGQEKLFGEEFDREAEVIINPLQTAPFTTKSERTLLYETKNPELRIVTQEVKSGNLTLFENYYDLSSIWSDNGQQQRIIEYKNRDVPVTGALSVLMWMSPIRKPKIKRYGILSISFNATSFYTEIEFKEAHDIAPGTQITIFGINSPVLLDKVYQVLKVVSPTKIAISLTDNSVSGIGIPGGAGLMPVVERPIIRADLADKGFRAELVGLSKVKVYYGQSTQSLDFDIPEMSLDEYYGLKLSIDNNHKKINLSLIDTKFRVLFESQQNLDALFNITNEVTYRLSTSAIRVGRLSVWNAFIDSENFIEMLKQKKYLNADKAIVIDDVRIPLDLAKLGDNKP